MSEKIAVMIMLQNGLFLTKCPLCNSLEYSAVRGITIIRMSDGTAPKVLVP